MVITSLVLMATDQNASQQQEEQQKMMKPLHCSSSEETRNCNNELQCGKSRGRKGSGKGPKKQPQRGLGIIQLERLRIQECWKKMNESTSSSASGIAMPPNIPDQHHQNFLQCHPQMLPFPVHDPFGNSSTSGGGGGAPHPVRYGQNHVQVGFQCPQQQVIHGTSVGVITAGHQGSFMMGNNNKSGLSLGVGVGVGGGWAVPNHQIMNNNKFCASSAAGAPFWSPLVGTPLETSTELSSMPNNVHSHHDFLDVFLKKTRFNEDNVVRGSNSRVKKDKPLDIWPNNNAPEFLGCSPQLAPPNQTSDFYYQPDEGVEVVAVHRKGNSVSGRVFMEYEFFPGKDARGTASKDFESPTIGSAATATATVVVRGDEASPIITTTATPFRNTAFNCDYVDLSLKLSR